MIRKGLHSGKLVVTATQMLYSMMRNPRSTRAEVSDMANAIFDGTGCVMLSSKTASGKYPLDALAMMNTIVAQTEGSMVFWELMHQF